MRSASNAAIKVAGVIAEYNPFHAGHAWQLDEIRRRGADYIVVAMSGSFVQRGEPALLDKHERARMALLCGADLVVALPFPGATSSAEGFASAGVAALGALGVVDELYFGSESVDAGRLWELALFLSREPKPYQELLREALRQGKSFPAARQEALLGAGLDPEMGELLSREAPNDILAVEYMKALIRQGLSIRPVPLPRIGAGHHGQELGDGEGYASAGQIREWIGGLGERKEEERKEEERKEEERREEEEERILRALPAASGGRVLELARSGELATWADFDLLLFDRLLQLDREVPAWMAPSLAGRLLRRKNEFSGMPSFALALKSRELTYTSLCRSLLYLLLNTAPPAGPTSPSYVRILGFRRSAGPLLHQIKEKALLPLATRPAACRELCEDLSYLHAQGLYEMVLSRKAGRAYRQELTKTPIVL